MKMSDFENMSDEDLQGLGSVHLDESIQTEEEQVTPPVEEETAELAAEDDAGGAEGDDKEDEKPHSVDGSDDEISNQPIPVIKEKAPEQAKPSEETTEATSFMAPSNCRSYRAEIRRRHDGIAHET